MGYCDTEGLRRARFSRLRPPDLLRVSEWADAYRYLSPEAAAVPGRFRTSRTPYIRELADNMGAAHVPELRTMKSSQLGYSEALNNYLARQIHQNPSALMMVQPDVEAAEDYGKDRIDTMLRDTPVLAGLTRTESNRILKKIFPGGDLRIVGANSPQRLASKPVRDVCIDEEDRTKASSGKEGDPEKLVSRRQLTFAGAKLIAGGTPVLKGASKTERGFLKGDQRRYMVPCPRCHRPISLEVESLQKNPRLGHYAEFECPKCGDWIEHRHKYSMIRDIPMGGQAYWSPAFGEHMGRDPRDADRSPGVEIRREDYRWDEGLGRFEALDSRVHSYYIWAAYSPFISWREICDEYNEAFGDTETLKTVYNTLFGLPYEYTTNDLDHHQLFASREQWSDDAAPPGILAVTAGVDTQDNRFEVIVVGWGVDEEAWILDFFTVEGDPDDELTRANLEHEIDRREYVTREEAGRPARTLRIRGHLVDSGGHRTDSVYKYVRGKHFRKVFACKGLSTAGNPVFSGFSTQEPSRIRLARVGTDTAKEAIYAKLAKDPSESGRVHFADHLPIEFFAGLISEERHVEIVGGQARVKYKKKASKVRNEPLDCFVYAFASLRSMKLQLRKKSRRMKVAEDRAAAEARRQDESDPGPEDEEDSDETRSNSDPPTDPNGDESRPARKGKLTRVTRTARRRRKSRRPF